MNGSSISSPLLETGLKPWPKAKAVLRSCLTISNSNAPVDYTKCILSSTTFSDGCLGSHNDEERSEMRYVMRIARPRESLKFWTHIALLGFSRKHAYLSVCGIHSAPLLLSDWSGWMHLLPGLWHVAWSLSLWLWTCPRRNGLCFQWHDTSW